MGTHASGSRWLTLDADNAWAARVAAVAEPGFVLIAGTLLAQLALSRLRVGSAEHYLYQLARPDFRSAAVLQLVNLTVRYGIILALAAGLGAWRGRKSAASYGLTLPRRRFAELTAIGVVLGLIASLPEQVTRLIADYAHLGPGTRFWALEARVPWDASFWLYMAVGSYAVVPIFEELFTRGYLLGRIRESFSAGGALLASAVFFTVAHGQYRHADPLAISSQASLFVWAAIVAYAVYRTASLLPAIIAHAIINVPMSAEFRWIVLALSVVVLVLRWKAVSSWTRGIQEMFRRVDDWPATSLALIAIVVILVSIGLSPNMPYVWLGLLGACSLLGLSRRSPWRNT
ncbi:MAG TPA: CPBP family intramembrane glutamic endopeptidase [Thermoanaerobaculia bacterium]|jgi:membrane protease YdiL (CAAX protease family)